MRKPKKRIFELINLIENNCYIGWQAEAEDSLKGASDTCSDFMEQFEKLQEAAEENPDLPAKARITVENIIKGLIAYNNECRIERAKYMQVGVDSEFMDVMEHHLGQINRALKLIGKARG